MSFLAKLEHCFSIMGKDWFYYLSAGQEGECVHGWQLAKEAETVYERLGMLVTSLRSINQGYCSHIVCSRRNVTILGVQVSF